MAANKNNLLFVLLASILGGEPSVDAKQASEASSETSALDLFKRKLNHSWTFWYQNKDQQNKTTLTEKEWLENFDKLEPFDCYGDLMERWNVLTRKDSSIFPSSRLYLFKNSVQPTWEDEHNRNGGKLLVSLPHIRDESKALMLFLKLIVGSVESKEMESRVCGLTCCLRENGTLISLWTPTQDFKDLKLRVSQIMTEESPRIFFKSHNASICQLKKKTYGRKRAFDKRPNCGRVFGRSTYRRVQKTDRPIAEPAPQQNSLTPPEPAQTPAETQPEQTQPQPEQTQPEQTQTQPERTHLEPTQPEQTQPEELHSVASETTKLSKNKRRKLKRRQLAQKSVPVTTTALPSPTADTTSTGIW
eukprot:CAMPEP_0174273886 /NCGR_PEP_ID=MMETSP0439-20130205/56134_1 /TAXON_ID=0 /ORGANISM="Stereomyxa ramosa, Strain Chinc5" /LENGTH=359 /DNA_ID=CAMNT_0015365343 /DNA_START=66 /DNA_END=1142 /DNA_ORIENTATION=-